MFRVFPRVRGLAACVVDVSLPESLELSLFIYLFFFLTKLERYSVSLFLYLNLNSQTVRQIIYFLRFVSRTFSVKKNKTNSLVLS